MKNLLFLFVTTLLPWPVQSQAFVGSFTMSVSQAYKNGKERSTNMGFALAKDKTAMKIAAQGNDPEIKLIFDFPAKTITQLFEMNGKKSGFILPMDMEHWPGMAYAKGEVAPTAKAEVKRTGQKKSIEGHACEEVLAENDQYQFQMWVAPGLNLSMTELLAYQSVGKGESREEVEMMAAMNLKGFPMEMKLTSKTDKADVHILISDINNEVGPEAFSTEGHELVKAE